MVESQQKQDLTSTAVDNLQKKGPDYNHKEQYEKFISGNEPSLLEAINTRTISLLTIDIK